MRSEIKVDINLRKSTLILQIRNVPLAIFYFIVVVLFIAFIVHFQDSLNIVIYESFITIIEVIVLMVLIYHLAKSLYGEARVAISKEQTLLFEGVFNLGKRKSIQTQEIKKVYVRRTESSGTNSEGMPVPREVKQHIIFETSRKFKFLHNQISIDQLHEFCNAINSELSKYESIHYS